MKNRTDPVHSFLISANLGICYYKIGILNEAIAEFSQA
jgi:hypothetical protein